MFGVEESDIRDCGDDDFRALDTFRRTPKADLVLTHRGCEVVLEIQSGFQGINDIKQSKILEAKRVVAENGCATVCVHFDMFNGQVAFVRLDSIAENDLHWVTRQQMEGQTVFNIDQDYFAWRIMDPLPSLDGLDLGL